MEEEKTAEDTISRCGRGGRKKRAGFSPRQMREALSTDAVRTAIRRAHLENTRAPGGVGFPYDKKIEGLYIRAVSNVQSHIPMANHWALQMVGKYRYVRDPMPRKGTTLYSFDGTTYHSDAYAKSASISGRVAARAITEMLRELLAEMEERGENAEVEDEGLTLKDVLVQVKRVLRMLDNYTYFNQVSGMMHDIMKSDDFYTELNMPAPLAFFKLLNANKRRT